MDLLGLSDDVGLVELAFTKRIGFFLFPFFFFFMLLVSFVSPFATAKRLARALAFCPSCLFLVSSSLLPGFFVNSIEDFAIGNWLAKFFLPEVSWKLVV